MKFLKKQSHSFTTTSENTGVDSFDILEISKVGFSAYPLQKISSVYSVQIGKAPTILESWSREVTWRNCLGYFQNFLFSFHVFSVDQTTLFFVFFHFPVLFPKHVYFLL